MIRVITQRRLAAIIGISEVAVSKAVKRHLESVKVKSGNKNIGLDVDNTIFLSWLAKYNVFEIESKYCRIIKTKAEQEADRLSQIETDKKISPSTNQLRPDVLTEVIENPPEQLETEGQQRFSKKEQTHIGGYPVEQLADLTVREVVMRYGSIDGFKRFVDSLKTIAEYNYKQLAIKEKRGELVDRDLVQRVMIFALDVAFKRLVSDVPSNIANQVVAVVESKTDNAINEVEKIYRDATSSILKNVKSLILNNEKIMGKDSG